MSQSEAGSSGVPPDHEKHIRGAVDRVLKLQAPAVDLHVKRLRQRKPMASPTEILRVLERQYRSAMVLAGGAVGAAAISPAVGISAGVARSGGRTLPQMDFTILFALAVAEVHGTGIDEVEQHLPLIVGVAIAGGSSGTIGKIAGRTGRHWARQIIKKVPHSRLLQINGVLGENFVTKYGTTGTIVLARVVPLGIGASIGAGAGAVTAEAAIKAVHTVFGPAPTAWVK
jgi:hypothetical protein